MRDSNAVRKLTAQRRYDDARLAADQLVELYRSGKWRSRYTENGYLAALRTARGTLEYWEYVICDAETSETPREKWRRR